MVLLVFFAIALRTLPSEYMSLAGVTGNPFKTSGAMCLYTSLYFLAFGRDISQTLPKSILSNYFEQLTHYWFSNHSEDIPFGACGPVHQ